MKSIEIKVKFNKGGRQSGGSSFESFLGAAIEQYLPLILGSNPESKAEFNPYEPLCNTEGLKCAKCRQAERESEKVEKEQGQTTT